MLQVLQIPSIALLVSALLAPPQAAEHYQPPVKIDVDMVLVDAAVTDGDGRPVTGLDKNRFQLWEDKIQQDIRYVSVEDLPISLGIVFDVSSSMAEKLQVSKSAVTRLLEAGNPQDEYALIEFANRPEVKQEFTSDIREFQNRLSFVSASGATALYDAVYLGIEGLRKSRNPRKALVLLTDGEDNHSRYSFEDVKRLAMESDIQLFAIGMSGFTIPTATKGHKPGPAVLQELVDLTGGEVFFTTNVDRLDEICAKISQSLRNEYVIGYASTNPAKDGKWRKLHVKVEPASHVSVHARSGYYARMQ